MSEEQSFPIYKRALVTGSTSPNWEVPRQSLVYIRGLVRSPELRLARLTKDRRVGFFHLT